MSKRASLTHDSPALELELPLLAPQERSQRSRSGTTTVLRATRSESRRESLRELKRVAEENAHQVQQRAAAAGATTQTQAHTTSASSAGKEWSKLAASEHQPLPASLPASQSTGGGEEEGRVNGGKRAMILQIRHVRRELKVNGDDVVYSIEIEPLCPHDMATTFGGHQSSSCICGSHRPVTPLAKS
ncbi:hypothetical protein M5D96_000843 [Drosophila gunungcola]|uniref:Uncharacterized protein n=1 Tax=Drosophila gunungcola TaxID=103775 RepID=A0A9Q0BU02_9MUSC|nr:hypothetical protein M5D96_000843 [Drosophila gunungcola]